MKIHNFEDSLKVGESGEKLFLDAFGEEWGLVDVRKNPEYQERDIDFLAKGKTIELKTDTYTNGNMFLETISAKEIESKGYVYKSQADYLCYLFVNFKVMFIFDLPRLREWVKSNAPQLVEYKKELTNSYPGGYYTSEGYAIPVREVCKNVPCKRFDF